MPTPAAAYLVDSGTRTIIHAIGATTTISVGPGPYGQGATLVAGVGGESGPPLPSTSHQLEVIANGITYSSGAGGASGGGTMGQLIVEAGGIDPNPTSFDAGFTLRFRSPLATFDGILAYAFFATPIDFPGQLFFANGNAVDIVDQFPADGGTIELPPGRFTAFHTDDVFTYGSKGGYGVHIAGGSPLFGTTAADWTGQPGWVNAARAIATSGSVSIGFYNRPGIYSVGWSISGAPLGEANTSFLSILFDILSGGRSTSRSFAQVVG